MILFYEFFNGYALLLALAVIFIVDVAFFSFERYGWSLFVMTATIFGGFFIFQGYHDFIISIGWHSLLLKWIPIYLGLGVITAFIKWGVYTLRQARAIKDAKTDFDKRYPANVTNHVGLVAAGEKDFITHRVEQKYPTDKAESVETAESADTGDDSTTPKIPPELEKTRAQLTALALRRAAFVSFYKAQLGYKSPIQIHDADYTEDTAVVDALSPRAREHKGLIGIWVYQWPIVVIDSICRDLIIEFVHWVASLCDAVFSRLSRKLVANATKGL